MYIYILRSIYIYIYLVYIYIQQGMYREFKSRLHRNLFFSSVRAGDNTNDCDSVPLDISSVWRGEGPGDHCYKVNEVPRTLYSYMYFVGYIAD